VPSSSSMMLDAPSRRRGWPGAAVVNCTVRRMTGSRFALSGILWRRRSVGGPAPAPRDLRLGIRVQPVVALLPDPVDLTSSPSNHTMRSEMYLMMFRSCEINRYVRPIRALDRSAG
jgi:hypothetical protein